ncbi:MAG: hypothetical protein DRJ03_03510 [Chloroflexi bacterium]|nr:MAG: hypothetical protein DRJ03_03510 [Chloroflexota bacterium]
MAESGLNLFRLAQAEALNKQAADPLASGVDALLAGLGIGLDRGREDSVARSKFNQLVQMEELKNKLGDEDRLDEQMHQKLLQDASHQDAISLKKISDDIAIKAENRKNEYNNRIKEADRQHEISLKLAEAGVDPASVVTDASKAQQLIDGKSSKRNDFSRLAAAKGKKLRSEEQVKKDKAAAEADERLWKRSKDLRAEFKDSTAIKDFEKIRFAASTIDAAFENAIDPMTTSKIAADQALVVAFNKMLDPGSVVRESEFARTPQGAAVLNRIIGRFIQIKEGGLNFTDADRRELKNMADELLNAAKVQAADSVAVTRNLAQSLGVPDNYVFGGYEEIFDVNRIAEPEAKVTTGQRVTATNPQTGERLELVNGQWVPMPNPELGGL